LNRLVIISNRVADPSDKKAKAGGLAIALLESLQETGGLWFGWSGRVGKQTSPMAKRRQSGDVILATIDLNRKDFDQYYNNYANRVLWPLFHYRLDLTAYDRKDFDGYLKVNTLFCRKLLPLLEEDDLIWVHDYHLIMLGEQLRRAGKTQSLGFFLHIPFPAMEVLTALPHHRDLVKALCAYDVVGFQTGRDLHAFHDYIVHEVGGELLEGDRVRAFGRTLRAQAFPISINVKELERYGEQAVNSAWYKRLSDHPENRKWILSVDRLDYSKGILDRLKAFKRLLERYPACCSNITLIQIAAPSRSELWNYRQIRKMIETEAGHINGRFAEYDWIPVNYLNRSFTRRQLAAFYRTSRIGLVTPLRDGMNLVAKEYIAAQNPDNPGVLVLSRFAGASQELDAALIVNPFDYDEVSDAIIKGLDMPREERIERWQTMMKVLKSNNLSTWRDNFIKALRERPQED